MYPISAVTGEGVTELGYALGAAVEEFRASLPPMEAVRVTITPKAVDEVVEQTVRGVVAVVGEVVREEPFFGR